MRTTRTLAALTGLVALAGCWSPPSLQPLYTDNDVVFEPGLVGTWRGGGLNEDGEVSNEGLVLVLEPQGESVYLGTFGEGETAEKFQAHLVRLGPYHFLDTFYDSAHDLHLGDFYSYHLIPAHTFSRVSLEGDRLTIFILNPDWLDERLKDGTLLIEHVYAEDFPVLTAPTEELQRFAVTYANDSEAFIPYMEFHRVESTPSLKPESEALPRANPEPTDQQRSSPASP